jgi:hypothetical protein
MMYLCSRILISTYSLFVDISERDPFFSFQHEQYHLFGVELPEYLAELLYLM